MNLVENKMGSVSSHISEIVLYNIRGRLDKQVYDHIHKQLWIQIMDHIGYEIFNQIRAQTSNQLKRNIWKQ